MTVMAFIVGFQAQANQSCNESILASTPSNRFGVSADEVVDNKTGLIWQKCSLGLSGPSCMTGSPSLLTWGSALLAADSEQTSSGKPWRIPNVKELTSIVEYKCELPRINLTIFPNTQAGFYWSSTHAGSEAWSVDFAIQYSNKLQQSQPAYIRLVRDMEISQ